MQFIAKLAFLLFIAIQSVCSMQNLDDGSTHTNEIITNIHALGLSQEETDEMIMEAMRVESMNSSSQEEQQRIQDVEKKQEKQIAKETAEENRSSNQCIENIKVLADKCFCGFRRQGYTVEIKMEEWCSTGSYCYDAYTSNTARDAGCYDNRRCANSTLEEAEINEDLWETCLCGSSHTKCGPGSYCSEKGQCLSADQQECERNRKVFNKCMCESKECQKGSVCVQREDIPKEKSYSTDQCMPFCDPYKEDGDDSECICSARNKNPLEIKFCENYTQTCTAENNQPVCTAVDLGENEEDTWDNDGDNYNMED